jgi:hypothetical protein
MGGRTAVSEPPVTSGDEGYPAKVPLDGIIHRVAGDGPRTHVLIVGVGHYPSLRGGGPGANASTPIGQIESCPRSARALAQWFIDAYHYPQAPLGTVALLTSEQFEQPFQTPSGSWLPLVPDYGTFASAAEAWFQNGNTSQSNRLIFIFCGHGYGYGPETSLLLRDFDFGRLDRWDSALDLGTFHAGMAQCAAAEQIFFIDACRRPHGDLLAPRAAIGRSPVHPTEFPRQHFSFRRNAPLIFSTGDEQAARGRKDGASVFTEAFTKAMLGMAARNDYGDWRVNNFSLMEAMSHVSWRLTEKSFPDPQQPQGGDARPFIFHFLKSDPISPIYITRKDEGSCGPGDLHYELHGLPKVHNCTSDDFEIDLYLPYGPYLFTLRVDGRDVGTAFQNSIPTFKCARLE